MEGLRACRIFSFQNCRREGLLEQGSTLGVHALLIEVLTRITRHVYHS